MMMQREWLARVGEQLNRLAAEIEQLGEKLCADPEMMVRNLTALQAIDAIAQQQQCLARIVTAEEMDDAVAACSFAELKERLLAA
ncbi:hypothetical protein [Sphingomonas sp.]|uniref:hypothetical protein n=1 Tax=Sphingomonas sp. TaxID=28214 RepID=UPI001D5F2B7A|nr:hypothetical protein [Sphingomonas sp.]MBX9795692.1 hypothetical protein [Sphingomonas sp.]